MEEFGVSPKKRYGRDDPVKKGHGTEAKDNSVMVKVVNSTVSGLFK